MGEYGFLYERIALKNNELMTSKQKTHFKDITVEFLKNAKPNINLGIEEVKNITKDGKRYIVNSKNKIYWKNIINKKEG